MKKRLMVILSIAVVCLLAFTACSTTAPAASSAAASSAAPSVAASAAESSAAAESAATGGRTIGLILISGINSHCQTLETAVTDITEAAGDKLVVLDSQFDTTREVQNIEDLITQKVDGIVLEVTGFDTSQGALQAAKDAGIPVAANDQKVKDPSLVVSQTVSDNNMAGMLCAQDMVKKMGETGEVLVITIPGMTATEERTQGFKDEIAKYPGIKIVGEGNGEGLIDKAAAVTENLMQANPNITGVFGANDPCALGALSAFESAGKLDGVYIYGVDGSAEGQQFIKDGKLAGTVLQKPYDLGKFSTEDLYTVLNGGTIDEANKMRFVDVTLLNSDNIDELGS